MNGHSRIDSVSRSAVLLVAGRSVGFVASFAIPVVLARVFAPAEFGTYKQLFLVFATLYGVAQLGMAESLYYFLPRTAGQAGRYVCNALLTLALAGAACLALLRIGRYGIASWLSNTQLADHLFLLGLLLALMLMATAFEIVMISRKQHLRAALTYATSDIARTLLFILPALGLGSVGGVLAGAAAFAALRLAAMLVYVWREFGSELKVDFDLWRHQLAYALPFALAVGIEVVQINFHQYVVASRFDAATFAIYAVGCMPIPLLDLVMTSTVNVMMVRMAEDVREGRPQAALALWHDTIARLALIFFPLAAFLMMSAHNVILTLFTAQYAASVPIFTVWSLSVLPYAFAVDGALRVYAQTRFLLVMNIARLAFVALLIGWFISTFGLRGAVVGTLIATALVKILGVVRMSQVLGIRASRVLPWERLGRIAIASAVAALPVLWLNHGLTLPPLVALMVGGAVFAATYAAICYGALRVGGATHPPSPRLRRDLAGAPSAEAGASLLPVPLPFVLRRRLAAWLTPGS